MSKGQTKKTREAAGATARKLTRAEKKADCRGYPTGKGRRESPHRTADNSLPCHVPGRYLQGTEKKYSKCIAFEDINYQLAQADDKTAIFENWCDFLNYFDACVIGAAFFHQSRDTAGTGRESYQYPGAGRRF